MISLAVGEVAVLGCSGGRHGRIGFGNVFWQELHGLVWYDFWDIVLLRILNAEEQ